MLCGCHSVAAISSCRVAPPGLFSSSRIWAVLLPAREAAGSAFSAFFSLLDVFLAGLAFFPNLPLDGATCAPCFVERALLVAFGSWPGALAWAVSVCSLIVIDAPCAVI